MICLRAEQSLLVLVPEDRAVQEGVSFNLDHCVLWSSDDNLLRIVLIRRLDDKPFLTNHFFKNMLIVLSDLIRAFLLNVHQKV